MNLLMNAKEIIKEVKENTGEELKKQHQGVDNLKKFFEENEQYIYLKLVK